MTFVPKVSKTFIFLGKITKIIPISLNYDPPILWFFYWSVDLPLQLSTEEYCYSKCYSKGFLQRPQEILDPGWQNIFTAAELMARESPFAFVPSGDTHVYEGMGLANAEQFKVTESPSPTTTVWVSGLNVGKTERYRK